MSDQPPAPEIIPDGLPLRIHSNDLVQITGFTTDRRLRVMAQDGILPKSDRAWWPTVPTLKALFSYYQKRAESGTDPALEEKIQKEQLENWQLKNSKLKKAMLPRWLIDRVWASEIPPVVASLLGVGRKLEGQIGREAAELVEREIRERLKSLSENPTYESADDSDDDEEELNDARAESQQVPAEKSS